MASGYQLGLRTRYEIQVEGILGREWSAWFDGFTITPQAGDATLLVGEVVDQAALHGVLAKIAELGLPLVSLRRQPAETERERELAGT